MGIPFHAEQLQFIVDIASHRNGFLDPIFRVLHYVDSPYFAFILVPLVWVGFSYKWGLRLFYLLVINGMVNTLGKDLVGWPRPCADLPGLGMFCPPNNGFPSGGAQTCMLLGGLLIYYWRTRAAWIIGALYIALISFSRLYLGVHYPIDLLGGWAVGLLLLVLYVTCIDPIEKFLASRSLFQCFVLSEAIPLFLLCITTDTQYHRFDAMATGLGAFLSLRYGLYLSAPKTVWKGILRGAIAVIGLYLLLLLFPKHAPISLTFGALALWVSLGASPMAKAICRSPS